MSARPDSAPYSRKTVLDQVSVSVNAVEDVARALRELLGAPGSIESSFARDLKDLAGLYRIRLKAAE